MRRFVISFSAAIIAADELVRPKGAIMYLLWKEISSSKSSAVSNDHSQTAKIMGFI
jgi:hypothetical protein